MSVTKALYTLLIHFFASWPVLFPGVFPVLCWDCLLYTSCAYTALQAELGVKEPEYTTVCILADQEEVGSDGPTGLVSDFVFHFRGYLADAQGANYKLMLQNAKCLSADVNAAFDPTFPDCLLYTSRCV